MKENFNLDAHKELITVASEEKFIKAETLEKIEEIRRFCDTQIESGENIRDALILMIKLHFDQKDRPQEPYLNHTSNVALRLINEYGVLDPNLIISALLHDSVEDQAEKLAEFSGKDSGTNREKSIEYIKEKFGTRVADIISHLSNPEATSENQSPEEKNKSYQQHVSDIIKDPDVALIKLSDFSENSLRLNEINDTNRRLKLSKKYAPVISIFIKRIQEEDIRLEELKKQEVSHYLKKALEETELFIKNFS